MKIWIVFASKNGVTRECAGILAQTLGKTSTFAIDLWDLETGAPSFSENDLVILGAPIRMGKFYRPMRDYLKNRVGELTGRVVGCFLCCGYTDMAEDYFGKCLPETLREGAVLGYFGGELKPEKLHGLDRLIVRTVRNQIRNENEDDANLGEFARVLPEILPENITRFAERVKALSAERKSTL